ncbi:MAG: hypothetical protein WB992_05455 [Bryobacteraceae bacterium]
MMSRCCRLAVFALLACLSLLGQEASSGISVPVTISGNVRNAHGQPTEDDPATSTTAGFRAVLSPTLRIGPHWFFYSALEVHSSSYFPYETGLDDDQPVYFEVMQAYAGYTTTVSAVTLLIKAGQLSSAFGLFPLEYDDSKMPLIDAPPVYTTNLPLRADQRPCGVNDILQQTYGSDIDYNCGGSENDRYGLVPVTLYGLPSIEAELSFSRVDARLQITNSSPANPQGLGSRSQFAQWTAGAGYTLPAGLHVGMSGFTGPYLDRIFAPLLPAGSTNRDYSASGIGVDAQWSRGAWSIRGEWQRFHFNLPGFITSPSEVSEYAEVKRILSPRAFFALRASVQDFSRIEDASGTSAEHFAAPQQVYELTVGYRLNRHQLLKFGADWTKRNAWSANGWYWPPTQSYTFEAQLVTSLTAMSKALR